ncbi:DUF4271 domain-containing protein [Sphingobacterium faecale]|uniref:DUF4271 domain-containing protein n=1 Tax=Sphingobacterium faecale TaxID=2803775 RepID=A0ABS1R853_9SPHI|nr:DUF4271 domain-containing protein [Sphingobacterium faecale]MBL1410700.1 DUF4271 domain-containing protein [Sphingobacterium faecale]
MKTKSRLSQIRKKIEYLLMLLVAVLVFANLNAQVAPSAVQLDSLQRGTQDSLRAVQMKRDSLARMYIFVDSNRPNHYMDSLRQELIVSDNDFISWMAFTKSLAAHEQVPTMQAMQKVDRPLWIIGVLILLFLGIGLVRLFFYSNFQNIIYGFFNDRVLAQISKEDSVVTSWPYIFLYIIFSFSLGLFILIYRSGYSPMSEVTVVNFLQISILVAVLFVAKIVMVRLIAVIFEVERLVREYVAVLYLVYFNSMLILMPLLLFVTFFPVAYFKIILIFFLVVVSILFLYRFLRTAYNLVGNLRFSIFYLILYLCGLEIAPILILVKTLNN